MRLNLAQHPAARLARHPAVRVAVFAILFRILSAILAFLANALFPNYQPDQFTMFGKPSAFWDPFVRYDSGWYAGIARTGYDSATAIAGGRGNIAFFPVYPLLMRYVGRAFGRAPSDFFFGGILVAWVSFVLAAIALFYLARLDLPRRRAERAVLLAMIFPFAFFFGVAYSESTYLLFTVLTFYLFRTRWWLPAGVCGALATATRVNGIMMLPALAWIAWRTAEPTGRDRLWAAAALVFVACGFGAYCLYIYDQTGDPLLWATALSRWNYHPGGAPWTALFRLIGWLVTHPYQYLAGDPLAPYDTLNGLASTLFLIAIPFVWRQFGAGYGLFMLANLWLPLSSGVFEGLGRYCAVLFPAFIWLAGVGTREASTTLVVFFAMVYTLCLALFTTLHPLF